MNLFWIFGGITFFGLVIYGLQILAVRSALKGSGTRDERKDSFRALPPISILKPLKGLEDNLFDNLESFCIQDYPEYEIICSLQDPNDPAYKIARKIKDRFPDRAFSILIESNEPRDQGLNPKVNNLMPAYRHAKHPYILISDSNVKVNKNYLKTIVKPLEDPKVGLVSNLIRGMGGRTLGALFENLHLNSFILGNVCFLNKHLGLQCVIGKSMLMRKTDVEAIGGLLAFKDVLAEDHLIGEKIKKNGKRVVISNYMVNNMNEYWELKKFMNRHTRWGKMRWKIGGVKYFSEVIINPVFISLLPFLFWGIRKETLSLHLSVSLFKIMGDYYLGKKINTSIHPFAYLLSPIKDLLIGLIWFVPLASETVVWRGNRYLIGKETRLSLCPEKKPWSEKLKIVDSVRAMLALLRGPTIRFRHLFG
jgi:ceramide glucosyltransferase